MLPSASTQWSASSEKSNCGRANAGSSNRLRTFRMTNWWASSRNMKPTLLCAPQPPASLSSAEPRSSPAREPPASTASGSRRRRSTWSTCTRWRAGCSAASARSSCSSSCGRAARGSDDSPRSARTPTAASCPRTTRPTPPPTARLARADECNARLIALEVHVVEKTIRFSLIIMNK